ncbi:DUF1835 domain-containing protein [Methyloprofundus sp.]|uniref:DUF1835 domain-containing protein n=1 Tax=Methyloprofundus sp. TaxID=2020875 RepID=UPI003D11439F
MKNIVNITNGDSAVNIMQQAGIPGAFLPWQDVLHNGPVPDNLTIGALSRIRAQFIADCGWGNFTTIHEDFIRRDKQLEAFEQYDKVILWFEHDLYDQLQLLQILDYLQQNPIYNATLAIICTDQYLGMQSPAELAALQHYEKPITAAQLQLASLAWAAFRAGTPEKWADLLNTDTSILPFLQGTVIRLLQEYPNTLNGLSRTAHQALKLISVTRKRPEEIFKLYQQTEERRFLGDSSFWLILNEFLHSEPPLIAMSEGNEINIPSGPEQSISITATGKAVLTGKKNWLEISAPDHWLGGVHLTANNIWQWDSDSGTLIK